jgi:hypothetical protein
VGGTVWPRWQGFSEPRESLIGGPFVGEFPAVTWHDVLADFHGTVGVIECGPHEVEHRLGRIHDLRHTAVALWIAAGASPKEVAARAGHTSVSFVLDRYGHLFPESDAALRDRLDALFRAAMN